MRYLVEYFNRSVLDEVESWPVGVLADYARIVELVAEYGPRVRMPHSRAMGGGLFELRARGPEGVGRAFYCYRRGRRVLVLHAIMKKTRRAPVGELEIARRRMKDVPDD